jgi:beta-lactamase regulating signal transducer with metallopeptidase domain
MTFVGVGLLWIVVCAVVAFVWGYIQAIVRKVRERHHRRYLSERDIQIINGRRVYVVSAPWRQR